MQNPRSARPSCGLVGWAQRSAERGAGSALLLHRCFFSKLGFTAVDGELRFSRGA